MDRIPANEDRILMPEEIENIRILGTGREVKNFPLRKIRFRALFSALCEYCLSYFLTPGKKSNFPVSPAGPSAFSVNGIDFDLKSIDLVSGFSHAILLLYFIVTGSYGKIKAQFTNLNYSRPEIAAYDDSFRQFSK
jgi:hypothetical protein